MNYSSINGDDLPDMELTKTLNTDYKHQIFKRIYGEIR